MSRRVARVILLLLAAQLAACRHGTTPRVPIGLEPPHDTIAPYRPAPPPGPQAHVHFHSLSNGFEFNEIRCILTDRKGFKWFATSEGLIRFDGLSYHQYRHEHGVEGSLNHDMVNVLLEDRLGNLWVGTAHGLNLYHRATGRFIRAGDLDSAAQRLNFNFVSALGLDSRNRLWVGTYGDGVNIFDPSTHQLVHLPFYPPGEGLLRSNQITCIRASAQGHMWVGSHSGLHMIPLDADGVTHFIHHPQDPNSLSNNHITSLDEDAYGDLWVGTRGGGLNRLRVRGPHAEVRRYTTRSSALPSDYILALHASAEGFLWVGTDNAGLARLDLGSGQITTFTHDPANPQALCCNSIWALHGDPEGRLWLGTYNRGVCVFDRRLHKFERVQHNRFVPSSLPNNNVTGFVEDAEGYVWVATDGGGIARFSPETRQFDRLVRNAGGQTPLSSNAIRAIALDHHHNIWLGTWAGGVDRLNRRGLPERRYTLVRAQGEGINSVFGLFVDSKGGVWALTAGGGLFHHNPESDRFEQMYRCPDLAILTDASYVTAMLQEDDSTLWVGTLNGLAILRLQGGAAWRCDLSLTARDVLSSRRVEVIFRDSRQRIWVGTVDRGLNLFNPADSTFTHFTERDGLPGSSIKGIAEDLQGNLWVSTNRGLSKFNPDGGEFRNFTTDDGLVSNHFYPRSCLRLSSGELLFGGKNGFNVFNPERITFNSVPPRVYLTGLRINNRLATIGAEGSPLSLHIGQTEAITLTHRQTAFSIDFVALNFTNPLKNQYKYKLVGFDSEWVHSGTSPSASYTNIPAGTYTFMVMGSNNDGVWSTTPAQLVITIQPPPWRTWWAYTLYLLATAALVVAMLRIWRARIEMQNQLKFERLARQKELELREMNIQFFTSIAHEFRTPLSLITAPLESLLALEGTNHREQLIGMQRNAERLLHLSNNLLQVRKLEAQAMRLRVRQGDLAELVREVASYFSPSAKVRGVHFSVDLAPGSLPGWFDPEALETALVNLLSNAFKFTPDHGRVSIGLRGAHERSAPAGRGPWDRSAPNGLVAELVVCDDGVGIAPEEMPHIFDKFYNPKIRKAKRHSGTGIGLALAKGLVELHRGRIWASSDPGVETRFTVQIPLGREAYADAEVDTLAAAGAEELPPDAYGIPPDAPREAIPEEPPERRSGRALVLIVEDNDELRSFLARELERQFDVVRAENGREGFEMARQALPDAIISDILMPECSGIELCRLVKADLKTCHIPIVLLTAKASIDEQIEGIEIGADAYITKPFSVKHLVAQVAQLVQMRRELYSRFSQEAYIMPCMMAKDQGDQLFLQTAIDYTVLNIANSTLSIEELSSHLNLSHSSLYRRIKQLTGMSVIEFIRAIRLKQALKLMETQRYTIAEVAYKTGFTSPSYFTKCFKVQYGKPPTGFRPE